MAEYRGVLPSRKSQSESVRVDPKLASAIESLRSLPPRLSVDEAALDEFISLIHTIDPTYLASNQLCMFAIERQRFLFLVERGKSLEAITHLRQKLSKFA